MHPLSTRRLLREAHATEDAVVDVVDATTTNAVRVVVLAVRNAFAQNSIRRSSVFAG
jgi:hypothetical protein